MSGGMSTKLGILARTVKDPQELDVLLSFMQAVEDPVLSAEDLPDIPALPIPVARPDSRKRSEQFDMVEDRPPLFLRNIRIDFLEV
jgi:hypothetical protein